jgi:hypothetical protein
MPVVAVAPCQCFSFGENQTTSPGRMGVPGGSGAGFEGDAGAANARRVGRLKQRVDSHRTGEIVGWALAGWL